MSAPAPTAGARGSRAVEAGLLVVAWALGSIAVWQVKLVTEADLGSTYTALVVVGLIGALGAHIVVRLLAPHAEPVMLPTALLLNMLGMAMILRLDAAAELRSQANDSPSPTPVVTSQLTWYILALCLFTAVLFIVRDHRKLQRYTYVALVVGIGLLLLPLLPVIGTTINGATLWITVAGFSFQPGEIAKIVIAVFLAGYLVVHRDTLAIVRRRVLGVSIPRRRDLGPLLLAWGTALGILVFQRDLGTSAVFFGMFVFTLFVATGRRSWLILAAALTVVGGFFAYLLFGHVQIRVRIWLDPFADAAGDGYQIVQALFGLANGGVLGTGWGQGYPQLVPFANSDFIFAALGEELGLTGGIAILVLFAIFVERGLRTAVACRDSFGRILAVALSSVFALQVFVVVGGVTKLIPMTGLTTPFMSAGGSALIANWIMVALLMRISDITRRPDRAYPASQGESVLSKATP